MNLVAFSIRTKGIFNFARRLWTVFTRFGYTETRIRRALYALVNSFQTYNAAPTFFIPAVVLRRHPTLISEIAASGAEIGVHGYVHNDYRSLSRDEQYQQTKRAISVFDAISLPFQGFRNPYLGWTEDALRIFAALGFVYESNEAVIHDVIAINQLSPVQRSGYEKSLALFQAIAPSTYTLRPYFAGKLLRIPTSIPDDEMLFDRLRITDAAEIGRIWCQVMQRVYDYGGIYTLNLHPERGVLCRQALEILLRYAHSRPRRIWLARLNDVARWWKERSQFRIHIIEQAPDRWLVDATCTARATLYARRLSLIDGHGPTKPSLPIEADNAISQMNDMQDPFVGVEDFVCKHHAIVQATTCPCIALSTQTPEVVSEFLNEQGYPVVYVAGEEASRYSFYLDMPEGLGTTRAEQRQRCGALLRRIEQLDAPLLYFGCWPDGYHAALAISGDIDSVTIQDFFLRVLEV